MRAMVAAFLDSEIIISRCVKTFRSWGVQ